MRKSLLALSLSTALSAVMAADGTVIQSAWLNKVLPDNITAYARIPHPLFYFGKTTSPQQPLFDHADFQNTVRNASQSLVQRLDTLPIKKEEKQLITFVLSQLQSPLEILVGEVSPDLSQPPALVIASTLGYSSQAAFESEFLSLFKGSPIKIMPQGEGKGLITIQPQGIPGSYQYDANTGKLLLLIGSMDEQLAGLLNVAPRQITPLTHVEQQIDQSGNGLLAWVKPPKQLMEMLPTMLPLSQEEAQRIEMLKLTEIRELALGFGDSDGRPKVKFILDMPNVGLRQLFPVHEQLPTIDYFGQVSYLTTLSLPNDAQLDNIIRLFSSDDADIMADYQAFKAEFTEETGINFHTLLEAIGQQVVFFEDDNGGYLATPVRFEASLDKLLAQAGIQRDEQVINGKTIHHVSLQKLLEKQFKNKARNDLSASAAAALLTNFYLSGGHLFWVKEGDYLVFNSMPQPLMARGSNMTGKLSDWQQAQSQNSQDATLAATINYRNLSQKSYYANLRLLLMLSDAVGSSFDVAKLPVANTLSLPRYGTIGLSINNGGEALRIEYSTENGINDIFSAISSTYGSTSIATIGILAAIAIPAYQDYITRSQVAGMMHLVKPLQTTISTALEKGVPATEINDAYPEIATELNKINGSYLLSVSVQESEVTLTFSGSTYGKKLTLSPVMEKGKVTGWSCSGSLSHRHFPAQCQR